MGVSIDLKYRSCVMIISEDNRLCRDQTRGVISARAASSRTEANVFRVLNRRDCHRASVIDVKGGRQDMQTSSDNELTLKITLLSKLNR